MKISLKLLLIATIVILTSSSYARCKLTGTIFDANTKSPLPGASIFVKGTSIGTTADKDGKYSLNIKDGKYILEISYLGYKKVQKKVVIKGKSLKKNFFISESLVTMNEIEVMGKSEERQMQERAMPMTVISIKDIQGTVSSVKDILGKTAGVKLRNSGGVGSTSRISVRGLEGKRIGFFIDGTPLTGQSDFIDLNDIPVDMIDRIEVYKGVVPAKFGGSAIGGAVNLVLKDYPPKYIDLNYGVESYNTHKTNIILKRNNPNSNYEFGAGGFYTYSDNNYEMELPHNPGQVERRNNDKFVKKAIGLGLKAKSWWFDEVKFEPAYLTTEKGMQGIEGNIKYAKTYSEVWALDCHMEKANFFTKNLEFEASLAYAYSIFRLVDTSKYRYDFNNKPYKLDNEYGGEIGRDANDSRDQKHIVINKLNFNYVLDQNFSFNLNSVINYAKGLPKDDLQDKSIDKKMNYNSEMHNWTLGLSADYKTNDDKFLNSLTFKFYTYAMETKLADIFAAPEDINIDKQDFGFSYAARYRFTSEFLIKGSYSLDSRLPNDIELLGDGMLIAASNSLKPEKNESINLGFMFDHRNNTENRLQLELNFFYMNLKDMIKLTPGLVQSTYKNFGSMSTIGGDFDIKWDITKWLYFYGNITYQDLRDTRKKDPKSEGENKYKGDRIPNIPYLYSNVGFELHKENLFGGEKQNTRFYFENSFVEEYFYDFEESNFQERKIPRASTFNCGLEHTFDDQNITVGVQVNNLTDETVLSEFNRPLPGRWMGLKLRYIIR